MTRKLESLFDLPPSGFDSETPADTVVVPVTKTALAEIDDTIDKISYSGTPLVKPPKLNEIPTAYKPAILTLPTALQDTTILKKADTY
jgi:hypothetical protein